MRLKPIDKLFCGWCGAKLSKQSEKFSTCTGCGYKQYVNPLPCSTVIISHGDSVLMTRRAIEPRLGKLDIPGGFLDITDTSMEAGARRELKEELGLEMPSISNLNYMGSGASVYPWDNTDLDVMCFFYNCKLQVAAEQIILNTEENSRFVWVTKKDLPNIDFAWDIDKQMLTNFFGDTNE